MMSLLLRLTILVIFGVVTSQNYDVNSKYPCEGRLKQRSVEATAPIPPDPKIDNEGIEVLLTRLENLCVEKLEFLITDTNTRFQSLENHNKNLETKVENFGKNIQELMNTSRNLPSDLGAIKLNVSSIINVTSQSLEVHSTVNNLLVKKLDNLTTEVGRMSQCCSVPATPVVQNCEIFDAKVENLGKNIQELMNASRNLRSDLGAIKLNVSSFINVTRSLVDSNSNEGLQEIKDLQTETSTSSSLNFTVDKQYPKNCREVREIEKTASGNYMIQPEGAPKPFEVVCDLKTWGGGWTVIQRRFDGSQEFYLGWEDYKKGFGNLEGEFWLGLENIHLLTGFEINELMIELGDFESNNKTAFYSQFKVGSEIEGYSLKVLGAYLGDAGNTFTYNTGMKFTTKDNDQDQDARQCAQYHGGAWWYNQCSNCNLNGKYFDRHVTMGTGVVWHHFKGDWSKLKYTRMSVRPIRCKVINK